MREDARMIISNIQRSTLRTGARDTFEVGDSVSVWMPKKKVWITGYYFLADVGRNLLIEKGSKIWKIPRQWTRIDGDNVRKSQPSMDCEPSSSSTKTHDRDSANHDIAPTSSSDVTPNDTTPIDSEGNDCPPLQTVPDKQYSLRSSLCSQECSSDSWWKTAVLSDYYDTTEPWNVSDDLFLMEGNAVAEGDTNDEIDLHGFDLSRLPPRIYITIPSARRAIRSEVFGLLRSQNNVTPSLEIARCYEGRYKAMDKIRMTLLVKLKAGHKYKARLCLRGDLESLMKVSFSSAPTVSREMLKILMSILANSPGFTCASLDISQAFIQADEVADSDQVIGIPPDCIRLEGCAWNGQLMINSKTLEVEEMMHSLGQDRTFLYDEQTLEHQAVKTRVVESSGHGPFGFLVRRPLYGSRHAPLRWWLKLSSEMKKGGYVQMRGDVCTFVRRRRREKDDHRLIDRSDWTLLSVIIAHVDDLLFVGNQDELMAFKRLMTVFRHGDITILTPESAFTFCGMDISINSVGMVTLDQCKYSESLTALCKTSLIKAGEFLSPLHVRRKECKSFAGAALWLLQSRYDISYLVSLFQTSLSEALTKVEKMIVLINISNRIVKAAQSNRIGLSFFPMFSSKSNQHPLQLFAFSDASFTVGSNACNLESGIVLIGKPIYRNGPITCLGHVIFFFSKKIQRVCRSSISAECVALANVIDFTLWLRCILVELIDGRFEHQIIPPRGPLPLISPFKDKNDNPCAWLYEKAEFDQANVSRKLWLKPSKNRNTLMQDTQSRKMSLASHCEQCGYTSVMDCLHLREGYDSCFSFASSELIHALVLTDCSNAISSINNINARCVDRCARLQMAYIRDAQSLLSVTFVCGPMNLGDVGTKLYSNLSIYRKLVEKGTFEIAFLSRRDIKDLLDYRKSQKKEWETMGKTKGKWNPFKYIFIFNIWKW